MSKILRKLTDINYLAGTSASHLNNVRAELWASGNKAGVKRVPQRINAIQPGQRKDSEKVDVSVDQSNTVPGSGCSDNAQGIAEDAVSTASSAMQEGRTKTTADSRNAASGSRTAELGGLSLDLSEEDLMRGIILSEILGRPRCLRKGR